MLIELLPHKVIYSLCNSAIYFRGQGQPTSYPGHDCTVIKSSVLGKSWHSASCVNGNILCEYEMEDSQIGMRS